VHGLRETQRTGLARKIIGTSPSISLPSPLHTHALPAKVAVAAHLLHLDTLQTLPSYSNRACALGHKSASALFVANLSHGVPVWYGLYLRRSEEAKTIIVDKNGQNYAVNSLTFDKICFAQHWLERA